MSLSYRYLYYDRMCKNILTNTWPVGIKPVATWTIILLIKRNCPHPFPTYIYSILVYFLWEQGNSGTHMPLVSSLSNYLSSPSCESHPEVRFSRLKTHFQQSSNEIGQRDTSLVTLKAQMFNRDKFKCHSGSSLAFELTKCLASLATEYPWQIHFHQLVWFSNS